MKASTNKQFGLEHFENPPQKIKDFIRKLSCEKILIIKLFG